MIKKTFVLLIGLLFLPVVCNAGTGFVSFEGAITIQPQIIVGQQTMILPTGVQMTQAIPAQVSVNIPTHLKGQSIGAGRGSMCLSGLAEMQSIQSQMLEGLIQGPSAQGVTRQLQESRSRIWVDYNIQLILE